MCVSELCIRRGHMFVVEFETILKKYNIPYVIRNNVYCIYGYRCIGIK